AGIFLTKLWNREKFTPQQTAAMLARGNIAIHVRLKGEMSEACLGLGPNGWAYVASLIKDGRALGVNVFIDEPYPQLAETPPIVPVSSFSLSSLFKLSLVGFSSHAGLTDRAATRSGSSPVQRLSVIDLFNGADGACTWSGSRFYAARLCLKPEHRSGPRLANRWPPASHRRSKELLQLECGLRWSGRGEPYAKGIPTPQSSPDHQQKAAALCL